jgi:valyl-tRNA synthetase
LIAQQAQKLANEEFIARAPENIVRIEREKLARYQEGLAKIKNIIT